MDQNSEISDKKPEILIKTPPYSKEHSLNKDTHNQEPLNETPPKDSSFRNEEENEPIVFNQEKEKSQMDNLLEELNKDLKPIEKPFKKPESLYNLYDFLFPGGKLAKLCRLNEIQREKEVDFNEILRKFKFTEQAPVVILSGAFQNNKGKFFAGIARACFRTDAVIIDSGIEVGIEAFSLRKGIKLLGVAPEKLVKFPKINPTNKDPFELTNGHTHLFLLNSKEENRVWKWGDESHFRFNLASSISIGRFSPKFANNPRCKIVVVLLGDNPDCLRDLEMAVDMKLPILVTRGSELCEEIVRFFTIENYELQKPYLLSYLQNGHYYILGSNNSEEIASFLHFFLTVTPYDIGKKNKNEENKGKH